MAKTSVRVRLPRSPDDGFAVLQVVSDALDRAGHRDLAFEYLERASRGDLENLKQVTEEFVVLTGKWCFNHGGGA